MEWEIYEHRNIAKIIKKLPIAIVKKYDYWKNLMSVYGPDILRGRIGLHDEKLKGERKHQRSSRLSLQYKVVYEVHNNEVIVYVIDITAHKY